MDRTDALKSIAAQAARGDLSFPTNVDATLKLQRALADPDCHIDDAARLVQTEPLLAARL
jgi:HD-like signal output (HDOD) protein